MTLARAYGWLGCTGGRRQSLFACLLGRLLGNDFDEDAVGQMRVAEQVDLAVAGEAAEHLAFRL